MATLNDFIGRGWAFPIGVSGSGGVALVSAHTEIEESIRIILATVPGERIMRPDFGCRIHELVFAPASAETFGLAQHYVEEALGWWEPRIDVVNIVVTVDEADPDAGRLLITITYQLRATKDERSLVFPFYRIEQE